MGSEGVKMLEYLLGNGSDWVQIKRSDPCKISGP